MTKPASPQNDHRDTVIFLNPNILDKTAHIGIVQAATTGFNPGSISMRNEAEEALQEMFASGRNLLVCTDAPIGGVSAPDYMMNRGIRATSFGGDWFAHRDQAERARAIEAWLLRNGNPPAIVIDRGPSLARSNGGAALVTITLPDGGELRRAYCREALARVAARAAPAAKAASSRR